jgi:hypothetical protein
MAVVVIFGAGSAQDIRGFASAPVFRADEKGFHTNSSLWKTGSRVSRGKFRLRHPLHGTLRFVYTSDHGMKESGKDPRKNRKIPYCFLPAFGVYKTRCSAHPSFFRDFFWNFAL